VRVALYIRERVLVEKPEGKRLLGRPRGRWKHDIKMELKEIGWNFVNWLREGTSNGTFLTTRGANWFSKRTLLHVVS
jgi:hypothetical protein